MSYGYHQPDNVGSHFSHRRLTIESVSRPSSEHESGLRSACETCHTDQTTQWLDTAMSELHGLLKPESHLVTSLRAIEFSKKHQGCSEHRQNEHLIDRSVSSLHERSPPASIHAISYLLQDILLGHHRSVSPSAVDGLWRLTESHNLDLRAAALTALLS